MQPRPEERLVGVDVADAGDAGLVEQERLQRRRAARRHLAQRLRRELRPRAARPRAAAKRAVEAGVVDQEGLAEAARVGEPELAAVVEEEAGAQVARRGRALALVQPPPLGGVELLLALDQDQVAGHPQVHDQGLAAVERQQQVLAAPPQPLDRPSARPRASSSAGGTGRDQRASSTSSARSGALPAPARAGGTRSRPRAARASPGSIDREAPYRA